MYVRIRGKSIGPLDEQKVHELVRQGKISRASEVSLDGKSWVRAAEVSSIFGTNSENAAALPSPESGPSSFESMLSKAKAFPAQEEEPCIWYYSTDGRAGFGPMRRGEIGVLIRNGTLKSDSLLWKEGEMADTVRYTQEFAEFLLPGTGSEASPSAKTEPSNIPAEESGAPNATRKKKKKKNAATLSSDPEAEGEREPSWKVIRQTLQLGPWVMFLAILASIFVASVSLSLLAGVVFMLSRGGVLPIVAAAAVLVIIAMLVKPLLELWKFQTSITALAVNRTETQLLEVLRRLYRLVRGFVIHILLLVVFSALLGLLGVAVGGWVSKQVGF